MPDDAVSFQALTWPPDEPCACGNSAAWEMILQGERIPLCSECYQIEALKRTFSRGSLLSDRIHRHWLIYLPELPTRNRSDGVT